MTQKTPNFSRRYKTALRAHLKLGKDNNLKSAHGLGALAVACGLQTLELAKLHEKTLIMEILPSNPASEQKNIIMQAAKFFAAAISNESSDKTTHDSDGFTHIIEALSDRTVQLATANQLLRSEVSHRKKVEKSLSKSERKHIESLEKSNQLRERMRKLSRRMIRAQEDERKKISRELHDVIAQELTGIHIQLSNLRAEAGLKAKGLISNITITQRRVRKSAKIIHKFARDLRPTALDDLGLTATLDSLIKSFSERTNISTHLSSYAGADELNSEKRTILYRVAQESLCNIERHAKASQASLTICKEGRFVRMEVSDNGQSFDVDAMLSNTGTKQLGLLGMQERLEMSGGRFQIDSTAGKGTKIIAHIPATKATPKKPKMQAIEDKNIKP